MHYLILIGKKNGDLTVEIYYNTRRSYMLEANYYDFDVQFSPPFIIFIGHSIRLTWSSPAYYDYMEPVIEIKVVALYLLYRVMCSHITLLFRNEGS